MIGKTFSLKKTETSTDLMKEPFYSLPSDLSADIEQYSEEVRRYLAGGLASSVFKARRVSRGIYEQRRDDTFMVRVRIAGGILSCRQARELAALAARFSSDGQLHVTTRQDIQMHDIQIDDTPEIMQRLSEVGLTTKGGGGNTVRNITACPYAGVCPAEPFDVTSFAQRVTEFLLPLTGSYNLPRKYKIAFSGCSADCALARLSDLGFIAEVKNSEPGFIIYAGGGMGSHSRAADLLEEWLPAKDTVRAAEAVRRLFDRLGDRSNKHRARLRFAVEKVGGKAFRNYFRREMDQLRDELPECSLNPELRDSDVTSEGAEVERSDQFSEGRALVAQHQAGRVAIPLPLPLGFIGGEDLIKLAELAENYSSEQILRTTRNQGLMLLHIPRSSMPSVEKDLKELSFNSAAESNLSTFVACAGASTCRLGLCLSRNAAGACAERLSNADLDQSLLSGLTVNISGCPNACGQHPAAVLGFFGAAKRTEEGLMPTYRVVVGGRHDQELARLARPYDSVPAKALPGFILKLLQEYEKHRGEGEALIDFLDHQADSFIPELIAKFNHLPAGSQADDYYWDWGGQARFSLAGRGTGECGAGVFDVIQEELNNGAKKLKEVSQTPDSAVLYQALLPTVRALLITRGVDSKDEDVILREFEQHFIATGLVDEDFRELLTRARGFRYGWTEALAGREKEINMLWERVNYLYSTLDANLEFKLPEATDTPAGTDSSKGETEASPLDSSSAKTASTVEESPGEENDEVAEYDLSGVPCPMNFVKAKLKLESMAPGSLLEIILDDGEPIQNVPPSLRNEGQTVEEPEQLANGQWRLRVKKPGDKAVEQSDGQG